MKASLALTALAVAVLPQAAPAQTTQAQDPLAAQLRQCMSVFGAVERLSCYDRIAHSANLVAVTPAPAVPPPAPVAQPAPARMPQPAPPPAGFGYNGAAPSRQTTPQQFGAENIPHPAAAPREINAISAAVTEAHFTPQGRFVVTLANGQVWQQIQGDVAVPNLRRRIARTVTIRRGALGSYNLTFSDQRGMFKVDRVR